MLTNITCEEAKAFASQQMNALFMRVPFTKEFHGGTFTQRDYYIRHLMETILRIRLNNEVDAYCLYKIGYKNNVLAVKLAKYLSEELGHEGFFMRDLKRLGVTEETLNKTKPFFSTEKLIGYMYYAIDHDGCMPTMVWNWLVEWYSDNYNKNITQKAANEFGKSNTEGFTRHIEFDEGHDHVSLMFSTVALTVKNSNDGQKVKEYITNFIDLIGDYFQELYNATICNNSEIKIQQCVAA